MARATAYTTGATVEALRSLDPGGEKRHEDARRGLERTVGVLNPEGEAWTVNVGPIVVEAADVATAVVDASADVDPTVVVATREGLLGQLPFGTVPGRRVTGPGPP